MRTTVRRRHIPLAILFLTTCADPSPVTLQLMDAAQARGQHFLGEWKQTVTIERQEGDVRFDRELRAGFRIDQARAAGGDTVNIVLALDSIRAAMNTPHGRQVYDMRELLSAPYALAYSRRDGLSQRLDTPAAASPSMGGPPSVWMLLDMAFPALPGHEIGVGDHWEHEWTRTQVDGVIVTARHVTTRYTLARLEDQDGESLARIDIVSSGGPELSPVDSTRPGTLDARGTALIGLADGVLRSLTLEETVTGAGPFPGGIAAYRQISHYRLDRQPKGEVH